MRVLIIQFPFGVLAFDENDKIVDKVMFPKDPQAAAKAIVKLDLGNSSRQILDLVEELQNSGYEVFAFDKQALADELKRRLDINVEVVGPEETEKIHAQKDQIAVETGFVKDVSEHNLWLRNVTIEVAKVQVKGVTEKRDLIVGQAIQSLDDLDKTLNLFMGRLREWYGVHFPELDRLVEKHETYARLVMNLGQRDNFTVETLEEQDIPKSKAEQIGNVAKSSMGADISEVDVKQIQLLSKTIWNMYKLRENMEKYLDDTMQNVAPNTKTIAGALLGARLIALAGGLHNLALRPASTMQVLGAEKALFRSIKTGARPPKHGLIFQHSVLHDAKRWQRGKIARAIAGKLAIAVRADAFAGEYSGDKLKAQLDKRIEEIRQKYTEPPPVKEQQKVEQKSDEFRGGRGLRSPRSEKDRFKGRAGSGKSKFKRRGFKPGIKKRRQKNRAGKS